MGQRYPSESGFQLTFIGKNMFKQRLMSREMTERFVYWAESFPKL